MAKTPSLGYVVPNPRIPFTLGMLNILFGTLLILWGQGLMAWEVFSPSIGEFFRPEFQQQAARDRSDAGPRSPP